MKRNFCCIADAVAYYFDMGYVTLESSSTSFRRVMYRPGEDQKLAPMIEIIKLGFLDVEASFINA